MSVHDFFKASDCDLPGLTKYLDELAPATRIEQATSINGKEQAVLWDAVDGGERLTLDDFVPADTPPLTEVIHWGKNNLPLFSKFQKRFCKPPETADTKNLWGYNESGFFVKTFVGPGYFVARETQAGEPDNHGVVVDYTLEAGGKVESWPKIIANDKRLSRFVYNGTNDYMRKVSKHVTIGRAKQADSSEWMPNWFMLCREE